MSRKDWDKFYLKLADTYSEQSTCPRAKVGCVIVADNRQIGAGFNGAISGDLHCKVDGDCVVDGHCERSIHAEVNAVLQALELAPHKVPGATAYVTHRPCIHCYKVMAQVGIKKVIYQREYGSFDGILRMWDRYEKYYLNKGKLPELVQVFGETEHDDQQKRSKEVRARKGKRAVR